MEKLIMQITVKFGTKKWTLKANPTLTISALKSYLEKKTAISSSEQVLQFGQMMLTNDDRTLRYYRIEEGSVISLTKTDPQLLTNSLLLDRMSESDQVVAHRNCTSQSKFLSIISKNRTDQAQSADTGKLDSMRQLTLQAPRGLSADAVEFVPKAKSNPPCYTEHYSDANYFSTEQKAFKYPKSLGGLKSHDIMERFQDALKTLSFAPSNPEEYIKPVFDEIVKTSAFETVVPNIVESLYLKCIKSKQDFGYIGARICCYLDSSLKKMEPKESNFLKSFLNRCQVDYDKREQLIAGSPCDQEEFRRLGMLLADLFYNAENLGFLPLILINIVQTLLSSPEDANIRFGCMMLKYSGSRIEDAIKFNSDRLIRFGGLVDSLKKLSTTSHNISARTKYHVDRILELKGNGWDTDAPSTVLYPCAQDSCDSQEDRGQDPIDDECDMGSSHILTEEEEESFLDFQRCDSGVNDEQDTVMGSEMEEAYEEFLNQQIDESRRPTPSSCNRPKTSSSTHAASAQNPDHYYSQQQHHQPAILNHHHSHHHHQHQQHHYSEQKKRTKKRHS